MKPTLLVLAAGMGSRYGGLKQLDKVGPGGDTIMDYSIYNAIEAGFGKIVFVIRDFFEEEFRKQILPKYTGRIRVETVIQELDKLPEGFSVPEGREKPWGTNHAVLMGKDVIHEPFAVINADDFYGHESFEIMSKALSGLEGQKNRYCMVGYRLQNTLSEGGAVSRGVCSTDENNELTGVAERTEIAKADDGIIRYKEEGTWHVLDKDSIVSMNLWGFTPDYFEYSEKYFVDFLKENSSDLKSEYYIPSVVNRLIREKKAAVKVYSTGSEWFGVTYPQDRPHVAGKLNRLTVRGFYPARLFN